MAFCKELLRVTASPKYPRPRMTLEESEQAKRDWWETGVDCNLEDLTSSVRMQRALIFLLLLALFLK